jgi:serine/threonine-protein kinase
MGVVYRAEDLVLRRSVALKTLPQVTARLSARLRAEAESMAAVGHPHLVTIYGAETWRGVLVLVMEYLPGGTLRTRLEQPMDVRDVVSLGERLSAALQAMHSAGLLHRDIKPSNIGFCADGSPKLLDFGLARLVEEARQEYPPSLRPAPRGEDLHLTPSDHVVGTPRYMAPELRAGGAATGASDVWSLGLVLCEALTKASGIPSDLRALLRAALDPVPGRRPSAQGLATSLGSIRATL